MFFGVKDYVKTLCRREEFGLSKSQATIVAVIVANVFYWIIRNPGEVLKTRQQTETVTNTSTSVTGSSDAATGPINLSDLYTGYSSNIAYALPADIIKFLTCTVQQTFLILFRRRLTVDRLVCN